MTGLGLSDASAPPSAAGSTSERTSSTFRPDLEGLRAIAVLLVLLFHAGVPGVGGGFVGVDVFFVLSGFLITGLIVRELSATGTLSLSAFYARRARRLLPAAAAALIATVAASAVLLPPLRVPDIAADGTAAALYVSNLRFGAQATDYFGADAPPSPLLHYWSLAVEEQFYLFWPVLLLFVTRVARGRTSALWPLVIGVGAVSFALSIALTQLAAPWAFYSLPTRAWELALGAIIALAAHNGLALPRIVAVPAGVAGIGLVLAAGLVLDNATPFPGTAALLPTVGAALVIAAGLGHALPLSGRVLALGPLRWVGRISYSLYLWHWPMLVIPAAALGVELALWQRVLLALATFPLAAVSHRSIEEPIRRGRLARLPARRTLALAGVLTIVAATVSVGVGLAREVRPGAVGSVDPDREIADALGTLPPASARPTVGASGANASPSTSASPAPTPAATPAPTIFRGPVPPNLRPPLAAAKDDLPRIYEDDCHVDQSETVPPACAYGDPDSDTTVVLFGDSHAAQWFPALERLAIENRWRLVPLTKGLCVAVDHAVWSGRLRREYTECTQWRAIALGRIAQEQPDLVVVANNKFAALVVDGEPLRLADAGATWDDALARMLAKLGESATEVVLIGDTPQAISDPPACLSANMDDSSECASAAAGAIPAARLAADRAVADRVGATFVDPSPWVCPTDPCPVVLGRLLIYFDGGHMTSTFSAALAPYLGAALPPIGR